MNDLYAIKDVARIFGLRESRLRYWFQIGFLWPSVRRQGRVFYTMRDLVMIKAAKELLDSGIPVARVRNALTGLHESLPDRIDPLTRLRVCSDGKSITAIDGDVAYEPESGQLVMAFSVASLHGQIDHIVDAPREGLHAITEPLAAIPEAVDDLYAGTEPHEQPSAYRCFRDAVRAQDAKKTSEAEDLYHRAIDLEPSMAAAHTNLGNLMYNRGELEGAREAYERALQYDPNQPEARYNLANLLEDLGETELAIAEMRRVCMTAPTFPDAHYNLGLMLAKIGGLSQAKQHMGRYLELDPKSQWAVRARGFIERGTSPTTR